MTLTAESWAYRTGFTKGEEFTRVYDEVSLEILNNLELVPNYKLVYLHNDNYMDI